MLYHNTLVDHYHTVKVENRVKTMCDGNNGGVAEGGPDDLLHNFVCVYIDAGSGC